MLYVAKSLTRRGVVDRMNNARFVAMLYAIDVLDNTLLR